MKKRRPRKAQPQKVNLKLAPTHAGEASQPQKYAKRRAAKLMVPAKRTRGKVGRRLGAG